MFETGDETAGHGENAMNLLEAVVGARNGFSVLRAAEIPSKS